MKYKNMAVSYKFLIVLGLACAYGLLSVSGMESGLLIQVPAFLLLFALLWSVFNIVEFKLYTKILLGLVLGILTAIFSGELVLSFYPVGQIFVRLIKMIVVPLVFASILVGTASLGDLKKLGRIGARTFGFYLASTAIAITVGLIVANALNPGAGLSPEVRSELSSTYQADAQSKIDQLDTRQNPVDILIEIIPENPASSMADGRMLQIIFFAVMAGIGIMGIKKENRETVVKFFEGVTEISIRLVHLIMKLAPYGVFALIASVVARFGTEIILTLVGYFFVTLLALIIHLFLFNSAVIKFFTKIKITDFWKGISPAALVAFSTSSSSATLPVTIECAEENLQVKPSIASFVLPLGSTINMDGTAIFQGVSAIFIATIYGMDLTIADQLTIILTATLASIGTAGAPQVGIIMLTMVLQSIGIPLEGIALILGVERFLDMARTTVNISSDLSCAAFVNAFEKEE